MRRAEYEHLREAIEKIDRLGAALAQKVADHEISLGRLARDLDRNRQEAAQKPKVIYPHSWRVHFTHEALNKDRWAQVMAYTVTDGRSDASFDWYDGTSSPLPVRMTLDLRAQTVTVQPYPTCGPIPCIIDGDSRKWQELILPGLTRQPFWILLQG